MALYKYAAQRLRSWGLPRGHLLPEVLITVCGAVLDAGHRLAVLPVLRADLGDRGGYGIRSGNG